jgi:acetolactate synthase-1/2/3 large subunit
MVTGRGILYLTDAVAKHSEIKPICVHHEQAGAFAACAYGEITGKPGVCLVSTGCASTNAVTGLLCAYQDGIPCVFISGNNPKNETVNYTGLAIRTFGSQEADIIPVVKPLTKYAVMLTDPACVAYELDKAIYLSQNGINGPVWIDVPLDIQSSQIEPEKLERFTPSLEKFDAADEDILYAADAINKAERPILLVGSGVRSAGATDKLREFVERIGIPVTFAHSAPDTFGLKHELSIGAVGGMYGTRAGNFAVQNSDLLLVLGCRLTSMTTGAQKDKFARAAEIITVDINPNELLKNNVNISKNIKSDIGKFLNGILHSNISNVSITWREKCKHWKEIFPLCEKNYKLSKEIDLYYLAEVLSEKLPGDSIFVCDAGLEELILPTHISFGRDARCLHPVMQGSMGYALPAAVGAYLASEGKPVCVVVGDGSIMMNLQELATIKHHHIPLKIFVVNNNLYSVIRRRQVELFRSRTIGTDVSNGVSCPEFSKIADCFDFKYMLIDDSAELHNTVKNVFDTHEAVLCEVIGVKNQEYIHDEYFKNSRRRFVHRPIEDQYPFLDRELFLKEMIIAPIDQ